MRAAERRVRLLLCLAMTIAEKVWTEKFVQLSHGKTRYWEAGTGTPTILLHGAGWNSGCESWALAMGPLSQRLRVLAIDCLNWGTGDVLDQEFSFAYLVDHVREFMDALGIEQANVDSTSRGLYGKALAQYVLDGTGVCLGIALAFAGVFIRLNR